MIKAEELRIGNLVKRSAQINFSDYKDPLYWRVNSGMIGDCENYKENWAFDPIPLSEDILLECGFRKYSNSDFHIELNTPDRDLNIGAYPDGFYPSLSGSPEMSHLEGEYFSLNKIEYLHQLQNLYFALTGQELNVNPDKQ